MPNKKAAKKDLRRAKKRAERNLIVKIAYKQAVKGVGKALESGQKDVTALLSAAQKTLDKAAKRGVIKKNTAARKLSRLAKKVKKSVA